MANIENVKNIFMSSLSEFIKEEYLEKKFYENQLLQLNLYKNEFGIDKTEIQIFQLKNLVL